MRGLHDISNDNVVRVVNFAISRNLFVRSTMFLHHNILKYTWTTPDGKRHNQIDQIFRDERGHSVTFDVPSFRGANCDIDHYLVLANVRQKLSIIT